MTESRHLGTKPLKDGQHKYLVGNCMLSEQWMKKKNEEGNSVTGKAWIIKEAQGKHVG